MERIGSPLRLTCLAISLHWTSLNRALAMVVGGAVAYSSPCHEAAVIFNTIIGVGIGSRVVG